MEDSLAFSPAAELSRLIRTKQLSPVELVDLFLERIRAFDPKLNAFITVNAEQARAAAYKAQETILKNGDIPPLLGIPISIKDLTFTRGIRTTGGSLVYAHFVPDEDTAPVERLLRAGAIIIGKTNTPEQPRRRLLQPMEFGKSSRRFEWRQRCISCCRSGSGGHRDGWRRIC
jgi:Asp-tRNA(Asn)/Glu-tRNA(Gln) amidotransferase A subunit family amidase